MANNERKSLQLGISDELKEISVLRQQRKLSIDTDIKFAIQTTIDVKNRLIAAYKTRIKGL